MEYVRLLFLVVLLTAMIASCANLTGNELGNHLGYGFTETDGNDCGTVPTCCEPTTTGPTSIEPTNTATVCIEYFGSSEVSKDEDKTEVIINGNGDSDDKESTLSHDNFDEPTLSIEPTDSNKEKDRGEYTAPKDANEDWDGYSVPKDHKMAYPIKDREKCDKKSDEPCKTESEWKDEKYNEEYKPKYEGEERWNEEESDYNYKRTWKLFVNNIGISLFLIFLLTPFLISLFFIILYLRSKSTPEPFDFDESSPVESVDMKFEGSSYKQPYQQYQHNYVAKPSLYPKLQNYKF